METDSKKGLELCSGAQGIFCLTFSLYICFIFLAKDSVCHQNMAVTQSLVKRIWTHWEETD